MESAQPASSLHRWLAVLRITFPVALIVLFVASGVPLFLRLPLWCDLTLYDLAAKNILTGGVHYRDVFDTNTPGFVWLLVLIRSFAGWSPEALRTADLLVVGGLVLTLHRLARMGGATRHNLLWLLAGIAGFYLFTHEMTHCQRDVWLALPALFAVGQRVKRIVHPDHGLLRGVFLPATTEGSLWAIAVWIKPHYLLVAVFVWAVTAPRLAGERAAGRGWLRGVWVLLADAAGNMFAGGLIGVAGVYYLMVTGTWGPFLEVMTVWNVGYMEYTFGELPVRVQCMLGWFPPWNFILPLTVALAVVGVIDARLWAGRFRPPADGGFLRELPFARLWHRGGTDEQRYARAVLAAVYMAWVAQGLFVQRAYLYVHAAEVMLGLTVWAAFRWNAAALIGGWLLALQLAWTTYPGVLKDWSAGNYNVQAVLSPHPVFDRERMRHWPDCFASRVGRLEAERRDELKFERNHPASVGWVELNEVADFLRGRDRPVGDRELICWHDSPHALYLLLDIKPGLRFMHVNTARLINHECDRRVCDDCRANTAARFAVIDLRWFAHLTLPEQMRWEYNEPGRSADDLLPPVADWVREDQRRYATVPELPFDISRTVFRSGGGRGRYVVFQLKDE